ncbi:DUF4153 domain-containing protein [Mucilaginibacter robiniae]|uniref:DUF4153 domain-containing protein n=1 Tax=Mucilaginibacter robiniae TaxID=2728022 RepID=A0A7L5E643_9SPHI|nr:DUF4153 domain-containing protein [Mucilaginibacter robiniae]QJD97789.1 DUF4153 domain-containing protein [Mucilaginibacter robiniae]
MFRHVANTIRRFPFELVFALVGTYAAVALLSDYIYGYISNEWYTRILMMAAIGLPSSLSASLFVTDKGLSIGRQLLLKCLTAAIAMFFLFVFHPDEYPQHIVHFALLLVAMHLLVSFAAFTSSGDTIAFWQFNKTLFIRLLTGLLYSLVLAIGLSAAFGMINSIFGIHLDWRYLQYTWTIIFGVFNTFFFLAGIPENISRHKTLTDYPKGLKFFSQYILIPLATVYLVILLVYELKILIEWELPKGMVSGLILGYAGLGLLALLLVYPIREQEGNSWIKLYSKYFYLFLVPLVALLVLAVTKRISTYGITQYRYFLIVLAVWLLFLIVYFLSYKKTTIKAIPISLFVIIMLIIYGPQSATTVSLNSQISVLSDLFKKENLIRQSKLMPVKEEKVKPYAAVRMGSTLSYILKHYDFQALQPLLSVDLQRQENLLKQRWEKDNNHVPDEYGFNLYKKNWIENYLNLDGYEYREHYSEDQIENELNANYYVRTKEKVSSLTGYDYMLVKDIYTDTVSVDTVASYAVRQRDSFDYNDAMILDIGPTKFTFSVKDLAKQIVQQGDKLSTYKDTSAARGLDKWYLLPKQNLQLTQQKAGIKVTVQVKEISFDFTKKDGVRVNSVSAFYFIKFE